MPLDVRDDMIAIITMAGFYARKRDWAMGGTLICARKAEVDPDGIQMLIDVVTLIPTASDTWTVQYSGFASADTVEVSSLKDWFRKAYADEGALFREKERESLIRLREQDKRDSFMKESD
jgi:hypothetical protein